jgi:hypothetical protein
VSGSNLERNMGEMCACQKLEWRDKIKRKKVSEKEAARENRNK